MSKKIISYEDACAIERVWDDSDIKSMLIFKEASEKGNCKIMRDDNTSPPSIEILVDIPDIGNDESLDIAFEYYDYLDFQYI